MQTLARNLLLLFVFAIPWEYSLDLGEPLGNIARIAGLLLLLVAIPAALAGGGARRLGPLQWLALAYFLFACCSAFWTIDSETTLEGLRSLFQRMMAVWLVWQVADSADDLRNLLRAYVAGSWVLAALTLANFSAVGDDAVSRIRFVAEGQDPNDAARFLVMGLPMAVLVFAGERNWKGRALSLGYLPIGLAAVLLTASRGGFLAALVALVGCGAVIYQQSSRFFWRLLAVNAALLAVFWFVIPSATFERLATIPDQLAGGDLNQRVNIWSAAWDAFLRAPLFGTGIGTFVEAAGLAPIDTAHNTALSIVVTGGLCALLLFVAVVAASLAAAAQCKGPVRIALFTVMAVWGLTTLDAAVEENRTTWLLFALVALAGRLTEEAPTDLALRFPSSAPQPQIATTLSLTNP